MSGATAASLPVPSDPPPSDGVLRYLGIEGCIRLPFTVDAASLRDELDRLPQGTWTRADRDPVVQAHVESFFAIGHPRGPRPLPPEDRAPLAALPKLRVLLRERIGAEPRRAIVARLRAGGFIPIHTDTPRFFRGTVRLSLQIDADGPQRLYCNGLWYEMEPGEVWAVDNLRPHAVWNAGRGPRVNVLADYVPSSALVETIVAGERGRGVDDPPARREIESMTRRHYRRSRWRSVRYELFKLVWRRR